MAAKNVKTVKVNLNQMLRKAMHLPITKSGYTLYTHVKNYTDDGTSGDTFDKGALADPAYMKLCNTTYNSPKNIRRLFVTGERVYVQYYTSPFVSGKQSGNTWEERALRNDDGKNLFDIAKEIVDVTENMNAYIMNQAVDADAKIIQYDFKAANINNLFKALSNGWVISNIEEFYVDWTALMPEEVFTRLGGNFRTPYDVIKAFGNNQNNKILKEDKIVSIIHEFNSSGAKNLSSRFPRLRKVAMIQNLQSIMINPAMNKANEKMSSGYKEATKTWIEANKELIETTGGYVFYANFEGSLENYKTAEAQYLFDSTLKVWFETYIDNMKKTRRAEMYGDSTTGEEEDSNEDDLSDIGELEQRLVQIETEIGNNEQFNQFLKLSTAYFGVNELKSIFSNFSKANRIKYTGIIGLKL